MIGPQEDALGGIASLVRTCVPRLRSAVQLTYLATAGSSRVGSKAGRLTLANLGAAISQYARFLLASFRFRPQVVHVHTSQRLGWLKDSFFVLAGKGLGAQVVIHVHGDLLGQSSKLQRRYTVAVLKTADRIITVAHSWEHRLGEALPASQIYTFVNCVDTSQAVQPTRVAGVPQALFLGRVGTRKGAYDLLKAAQILSTNGCSMHLTIAGEEDEKGGLARLAAEINRLGLHDTVDITGPIRGGLKWELLAKTDVFVLPSHAEQLPISLLEAMAAGCAVVATRVGGIPDVVDDGINGLLVEPGDILSLSQKLEFLCRNRNLRGEIGQRNWDLAREQLDVVPYVSRMVKFYETLVGTGAG